MRDIIGFALALSKCRLKKSVAGPPLAHAPFLPDPRVPRISVGKRRDAGAYSTTAGPCGPRRLRKPPREPCGLSGTSRSRGLPFGTRVRRFWARPAFRDPPLPCRSTRAGSTWDALFASETVATHDIAAARTTAVGRQGLLDLHPQRASIQAPATATSGVGSKRPVMGSDAAMIGTVRTSGDKRDCG